MATVIWLAVCTLGILLSIRSIVALRAPSAWTIAGWAVTAAYFALAAFDAARAEHAPAHADYAALALLTACFIVAGRRDEPQAEPWWWPRGAGPTGAQRRATAASREDR